MNSEHDEKEETAMSNGLKVLQVALQEGNYNLAAHALVYGLVKVSIAGKSTLASPAVFPAAGMANPASLKVPSPSHIIHVAHKCTPASSHTIPDSSHQLTPASSSVIPAKAGIHKSGNPSSSRNSTDN
jgi:hypothetical protein